jgi:hypothetical protein
MKTRLILAAVVGLLSSAGLAHANTIIGVITNAPDGSGGMLWTYPIIFTNSAIDASQPTSFVLDDFGALKTTGPLATGFSFTPGVTFTLTNNQLVGPNFGLPGFQPNNPSVLDVVITFTASASMGAGDQTFNLVLDTANTGTGGLANFFSQDRVATGALAGTPNAAQQNITTPTGISVPDGGATAGLLGAALLGLGLLRKKLGHTS